MWFITLFKKKPVQPTLRMWRPPKGSPNSSTFVATIFLEETKVGEAHGHFQKNGPFTVDRLEIFVGHRDKGFGSFAISKLRAKAGRRKDRGNPIAGLHFEVGSAVTRWLDSAGHTSLGLLYSINGEIDNVN